jgi:hypothetical protein
MILTASAASIPDPREQQHPIATTRTQPVASLPLSAKDGKYRAYRELHYESSFVLNLANFK